MGEQIELEDSIHLETVEREIKGIIAKMQKQIDNQRARTRRAETRLEGITQALTEWQGKQLEARRPKQK